MRSLLRELARYLAERKLLWGLPVALLAVVLIALASLGDPAPPAPLAPEAPTILLVDLLRDGRGSFVNAGVEPSLGPDRFSLHPNRSGKPPAEAIVPVEVPRGSCFAATLLLSSEAGDGVIFSVVVVDGAEATEIVNRVVTPSELTAQVWGPSLERWEGKRVELHLRTLPGATPDYDWAFFVHPRLRPCGRSL